MAGFFSKEKLKKNMDNKSWEDNLDPKPYDFNHQHLSASPRHPPSCGIHTDTDGGCLSRNETSQAPLLQWGMGFLKMGLKEYLKDHPTE